MRAGTARRRPARRHGVLALSLCLTSLTVWADAKFESVSVRVEHNVTDKDYEVVIEATGGDTGMAALKVTAPDGRVVLDVKAPETNKLGWRTFRLETPEPRTLSALQSDYPAGAYTFSATTVTGLGFSGTATLSHVVPAAATILHPRPDQKAVPASAMRLQWSLPQAAASVSVTIENDESGVKVMQAVLPGDASQFMVPGLLMPGTRYKIAIGSVARSGNGAFVESAFTTAPK